MLICYTCNKLGHKSTVCPKRSSIQGSAHMTQTYTESVQSSSHENDPKTRESLMMIFFFF